MTDQRMRLFAFDFQAPAHLSAGLWRHPLDQGHRYNDLQYWVDYAKMIEEARFDGVFFADNSGYQDVYQGSVDAGLADAAQIPAQDPFMVISAMAAATKHIGFGVTASTSYEQPYALARRFATLDHLTKGRIGWNVVTSYAGSAGRNLGTGALPHSERYAMAAEHLEVCFKLWESSWDEDAIVRDAERCVYVEPSRVHPINHHGKYFDVPGIGQFAPSPQRSPVIFEAGTSPKGIALAAQTAEAVFVNAVTIAALKRQVDALRKGAAEAGRDPRSLKVLQMLNVIVAPTDEEAQAKYDTYRSLVSYAGAMARYSGWTGVDMSQFDPDVPLKNVKTDGGQSTISLFTEVDSGKDWTPRDIAEFIGIAGTGPSIVGSPTTVADELCRWVDESGADGFNLASAVKYQDLADFIEHVVPVLQKRGRMWTEYDEGSTLREKLHGAGNARLLADHPARRLGAPLVDAP
jgi:FMN-dependent oxidoreductase (nitrilotriacetate monooxygenase family)